MRRQSGRRGDDARGRGDRGAALVEAALVLPVVFLFVFGVIDFGRVYQLRNQLSGAAREGAAFAQSFPLRVANCSDNRDVTTIAAAELNDLASSVQVTVSKVTAGGAVQLPATCDPAAPTPGDRFIVSVSATFKTITPIVAKIVGDNKTITRSIQVVYQG